jgi:hypothetical protein
MFKRIGLVEIVTGLAAATFDMGAAVGRLAAENLDYLFGD